MLALMAESVGAAPVAGTLEVSMPILTLLRRKRCGWKQSKKCKNYLSIYQWFSNEM
jgi:hypothetical protein